jgi:hypothetical protein
MTKPNARRWQNLQNLYDIAVNLDHYWSLIDRSAGASACWPYHGPKHRQGYGFIGARRYSDEKRIMVVAHRVGMRIKLGRAISPREMVIHTCSTMECQNPDHLILGDATTRTQNMYRNGRQNPVTGPHSRSRRPQQRKYRRTIEEMLFIKDNPTNLIAERFGITRRRASMWKVGVREGYAWLESYRNK